MTGALLQCVGVFHNSDIVDVSVTAAELGLATIQLHDNGDQVYVDTLREISSA